MHVILFHLDEQNQYFWDIIKMRFRSIITALILIIPAILWGQSDLHDAEQLQNKIEELSGVIEKLKAERHLSDDLHNVLRSQATYFSVKDSIQLVRLRQKQMASRARIDALTYEVIQISQQLQDPKRRYALAVKMQERKKAAIHPTKSVTYKEPSVIDSLSNKSIDLAALSLVRQGMTMDQARLKIIDLIPAEQIVEFYHDLSKEDRYSLYDLADNIIKSEGSEVSEARRTALYFYFYSEK
jgi:hypothetical protein